MKKYITSVFMFATLLGITPQINNLTMKNINLSTNEKTLQKINQTSLNFLYIEKYFNSKTLQEKEILKKDLFSALNLKNKIIKIENEKINQKQWDAKIYKIITSEYYVNVLNFYYQNKLLIFNDDNKANFINNFNKNKLLQKTGIWTETYWYWFGYWKLHLGHDVCITLKNAIFSVSGFVSALTASGLAIEVAVILAPVLLANWALISIFDIGNGIWIGWMMWTPYMGYGSNN